MERLGNVTGNVLVEALRRKIETLEAEIKIRDSALARMNNVVEAATEFRIAGRAGQDTTRYAQKLDKLLIGRLHERRRLEDQARAGAGPSVHVGEG